VKITNNKNKNIQKKQTDAMMSVNRVNGLRMLYMSVKRRSWRGSFGARFSSRQRHYYMMHYMVHPFDNAFFFFFKITLRREIDIRVAYQGRPLRGDLLLLTHNG
jgi:hypothetical protein